MIRADLRSAVDAWSAGDPDPATRDELASLLSRDAAAELEERFSRTLDFGTAGLRAPMGAGPARMNRAVVRTAVAALARWLLRVDPSATRRGVVVARDARRLSREFATDAAAVLAAANIPAWVFPSGVPTPLAAHAVAALGAAAGVVITASHNPPEYNGCKFYGPSGAQLIPPDDAAVAAEMARAGPASELPVLAEDAAHRAGLLREVGPEVRAAYLDAILGERRHPGQGTDLVIAYTALHGVGGELAVEALRRAGFDTIHVVAEQQHPDPAFPTVAFPNPEEPAALDRVRALAESVRADLVLANDPDADRLGVLVRDPRGALRLLSGNEVGALLGHYLLTEGPPLPRPLVMSTVVSSVQLRRIALALGAAHEETLTGFKWIANRALKRAAEDGSRFVFGYEEALGYGVGRAVHDKDGIGAAVALADLVGWARGQGRNVVDLLDGLARRFGVHATRQRSITLPGAAGAATIARVMEGFRDDAPGRIAGRAVAAASDYLGGWRRAGGRTAALHLPRTDLLCFELSPEGRALLRPSGTEPKLKVYVEVVEEVAAGEPLERVQQRAGGAAEEILQGVVELARSRGLERSGP
ncbi:MAG TPA: phospho-sugar mutase [Myxococcaceae bacterium]|jgi:phosphomannomutase|nr:phospho-sugar mutase [Myxococcaceae bacterium]